MTDLREKAEAMLMAWDGSTVEAGTGLSKLHDCIESLRAELARPEALITVKHLCCGVVTQQEWDGGVLSMECPDCNRAEQSDAARELAITAISRITGDDFCEDLDCMSAFHPETMSELEKSCHEKLSLIYRIAHSHNTSASCYDKHENWRKLATEVLKGGEL